MQVFKPALDKRYGRQWVPSRNGASIEAISVGDSRDLRTQLDSGVTVVAIDEVQFLDEGIVELMHHLADRGVRVIAAGLDMDFRGEPFGPVPKILAQAESVDKLQAICMVCGAPAGRTQRIINGQPAQYTDPVILVGAQEVYEARCREHHVVPGKPRIGNGERGTRYGARGTGNRQA